jgi:hypothetical protein
VVDLHIKLEVERTRVEEEHAKQRRLEELKAAAVLQRNTAESRRKEVQQQCRALRLQLLELNQEKSAAIRIARTASSRLKKLGNSETRRIIRGALDEVYIIYVYYMYKYNRRIGQYRER